METVNDAITNALLQIFRNKHYIPLYPFKTIIQCVLRDEASEGISQDIIDYATIPSEEMHLQIKIVMFGDSTFVGTKHLVKLVSASSVKELKPVSEHIRSAFGNQVQTYKTERIEANFIDVYLVNSCLSHALVRPLQHKVDTILEVVIKGKVDESVNLFIRRILEDAHITETSHSILTSKLTVSIRDTVEEIDVYSMRERRQQVINALKAAVLDEGEIVLEAYIHTNKTLLGYDDKCTRSLEATEGFIRLRRRYKLSVIDESNRDNIVVRCFSHNPLESIALGVFASLKDADMYLKCISEHLRRMKPRSVPSGSAAKNEEVDKEVTSSDNATLLLNTTINTLCEHIVYTLHTGELGESSASMLVALGLLSCSSTSVTYGMQQVRYLAHSPVMHIHAVRCAVHSVYSVMLLLIALVQQSPAVHAQLRGHALSTTEVEALDKIHALYNTLSPAIKQLRYMLLELFTLNQYSELSYLSGNMMDLLWGLFDPITRSHTILKPLTKGVSHTVHTMQHCTAILHKLNCALHMVELSIGTEILVSTIKHDILSYKSYSRTTATSIGSILNMNLSNTNTSTSAQASNLNVVNSASITALVHPYTHLPRCMSDLLGYAAERTHYVSNNLKMVYNGDYSALQWRPVSISQYLNMQLLPEDGNKKATKQKTGAADSNENTELHLESVHHLWDLYALLGEYNVTRLGGIDSRAITQLEWERYDYPRFMCVEASKLRYLSDIKVLQALQKGLFMALVAPSVSRPLSVLSRVLYEYSCKVSLFANVSDASLRDYVMQPARRDRIVAESTLVQSGLYKIPICSGVNSLYITGGVLCSDRVLTALGAQADRVFVNMWNLPPLFNTTPTGKPGIQVKALCGVALTTAVHWCAPHFHTLRTIQESRTTLTEQAEEENRIDYTLLNLPQKVEKKRMFGFGRKKKQSDGGATSAEADNDDAADDADVIDYYASEDEDDAFVHNTTTANTSTNTARDTPNTSNPNTDTNTTSTTSTVDPDSGVLRSRGAIDLEVVLRVSYDTTSLFDQVQSVFAREVGSCLQYLTESADWKPSRVSVHRESNSAGSGSGSGNGTGGGSSGYVYGTTTNKVSIFECTELGDRRTNSSMWTSLEECIAQYSSCIIETGVIMPEVDSALSKAELVKVFEQVVFRGKNASTAAGDNVVSSNIYYSADFNDVRQTSSGSRVSSPRSANITSKRNAGARNSTMGGAAGAGGTPNKAARAASPTNIAVNNTSTGTASGAVVVDEDQHSLDPTRSDADRLCRDSHVRALLQRAAAQASQQRAQCYIPCRIRFTLLAQLSPRMTWGASKSTAASGAGERGSKGSKFNPVQQAARGTAERFSPITGHQSNPLTIGTDATVARLLASTLWVSPEAARGVWQCATGGEAQCILYESNMRHVAYHRELSRGSVCGAYEHVLVNSMLTQNYAMTVSAYRAMSSVAFKFRRLVEVVGVCKHILTTDNTTYNVPTLGVTIARYVCLGHRYLLMSPQVAHLRGGCAYLLQCMTRIETLLQLVPISSDQCMTKLPTRLNSVDSAAPSGNTSTFAALFGTSSTNKRSAQASKSADLTNSSASTTLSPPLMVQPDDVHFEAALAGATSRNTQAAQSRRLLTVPLDASASTSAALGVGEEGLRRVIVDGASSGSTSASGISIDNSGEVAFRRALGSSGAVAECIALLHTVENMSQTLLHALGQDLHANFENIHAYMCTKQDIVVHVDSMPYAVRGLGVQKHGVTGSGSQYKHPEMVASGACLDDVLGAECTVPALVSYITRAESPLNTSLGHALFKDNIHSVVLLQKFKKATQQVLNSAGLPVDRHRDFQRLVALANTLSRDEQASLREVIKSTSLLHAPNYPLLQGGSVAVSSGAGTSASAARSDPLKRFKAGAELIKLMTSTAASTSTTSDATNTIQGLEDRARLHSVVHSLTRGSGGKGVSNLFKKLNISMSRNSSVGDLVGGIAGSAADGDGSAGASGDRRISKETLNSSTSAASIHNTGGTTTDSTTNNTNTNTNTNTADTDMNSIQSLIDQMFQKSDSDPHTVIPLALNIDSASSSAASINNNRNSTVQAEAAAFYRAPVAAPLSRFHDEKVKQNRQKDGFFQLSGVSSDSTDNTNGVGVRSSAYGRGNNSNVNYSATMSGGAAVGMRIHTNSDSEEEILLSNMQPAHSSSTRAAHNKHTAANTSQSTGVRVFDSATRNTGHVSLLDLLRQSMAETDTTSSANNATSSTVRSMYHSTTNTANSVEKGGMLHSLRGGPKPDHQQPRDVYF